MAFKFLVIRWLPTLKPYKAHPYGPRDPILKLMHGMGSSLTMLSLVKIRSADFELQISFKKWPFTKHLNESPKFFKKIKKKNLNI